jgi:hypothetical protein
VRWQTERVVAAGDMTAIGRTSTTTETTRGNAEDLEAPKQSLVEDVMKIESLNREGPEIALRLLEIRSTRSPDHRGKALQHRSVERAKGHFHHKPPRSS